MWSNCKQTIQCNPHVTAVTLVMIYALQKALEQTGTQKYVGSLQVNLDLTGGKHCGAAY